jgi:hypothetical protein
MNTFRPYFIPLHIAEDETSKEFSMRPEFEIIGEESSGRVDYAITVCEFFLGIFRSYFSRIY